MNDTARTRPPGSEHPDDSEHPLRDFWNSRPRRPRHDRKIAGVAAGVGYRYDVDPAVIRVVFVVTALCGGMGGVAYLLGWLFLADDRDAASPIESLFGRGHSGASTPFTLVLGAATFIVASWTFSGGWFRGTGITGLALLVAGLYLLHRHRGHRNRGPHGPEQRQGAAAGAPAAFTQQDADAAQHAAQQNEQRAGQQTGPPAWDPLAAAPLGWELPDPATEATAVPDPIGTAAAPAHQRRHPRIGFVTFALALLVAGVGAAFHAASAPDVWTWFTVSHVVGLVLAVLGVGLTVSAFLGGARGLILLVLPVSLLGIVLTVIPVNVLQGGFGTVTHTPRTAAELRSGYEQSAGELTLNLTELRTDGPVDVDVMVGVGQATVVVPAEADVDYTCSTSVGTVNCLDRFDDGIGTPAVSGSSQGAADQQYTVNVTAGVGSVEVRSEP